MGGCASKPAGMDLPKAALPVDNPASPSTQAPQPQTTVAGETGKGGDVEKKEAVAVDDNKAEEAKPEATTAKDQVKTESPVEVVAKKEEEKEVAVTTTEEKKVEAVVAPKAETAEKAADPAKVEEKTGVSPVTTA